MVPRTAKFGHLQIKNKVLFPKMTVVANNRDTALSREEKKEGKKKK